MSRILVSYALSCASALLLVGCGSQLGQPIALEAGSSTMGALQGSVHGGQPPVAGSHVYVLESVATGYGVAAHSLLTSGAGTASDGTNSYVTTDANGNFGVSGLYSCTVGAQVYLLALGGNAGGGANSAIGLMAALGPCPSLRSLQAQVPFVVVNEVSTVTTAYALAGFMSSPLQLSVANTTLGLAGLANAMGNALNIENVAVGSASTVTLASGSTGTVPQAKIYALANILASCVNSTGSSSTPCTALLGAATSNGTSSGTAPANTAQAILNIAHNPGSNVTTLYNLGSATPVFAPTLSAAPNDFLLPVTYASPITAAQNGLAIDAAGNAWVAGGNVVGKITPLGVPSLVYTGLASSNFGLSSLAIASTGTAWVSDSSGSTVTLIPASGPATTSVAGVGGLNGPVGIAFDSTGRAWVENYSNSGGNSASLLTSSATAANATAIPFLKAAYQIAVDSNNAAWASSYDTSVKRIASGAAVATSLPALSGYNQAVAIDSGNFVWVGGDNGVGGAIAKLSNAGAVQGTFTGGGASSMGEIAQLAIDGGGNVWGIGATFNFAYTYSNFIELSNSGASLSPAAGYQNVANFGNLALAIDGSGDVWVTNSNKVTTEFLGAAVPVATPVLPAQLGVRP